MGVDYEYGKVFGKQDADKYFGGMLGESTTCPAVHCPKIHVHLNAHLPKQVAAMFQLTGMKR